ncbi:MAG: TlpA disulfide reductase family protein [Cyclobacteriaceae bacterium]
MKIVFVIFIFLSQLVQAQSNQTDPMPEVGKPIPDFTLNNIRHFKKQNASSQDFKGKWLFLDFWSIRCTTCIHSFPKVNAFHQQFADQLNWVMVGLNGKKLYAGTEEFYQKMSSKQNLQMTFAFDSLLATRWAIQSLPHIIVVNPEGIVYAITSGRDMDNNKIKQLLSGKDVSFYIKDQFQKKFEPAINPANEEIPPDKLLLFSMLTAWNGEKQNSGFEIDRWVKFPERSLVKGYSFAMVPLYALYNYAFFGQWDWHPDSPLYNTTYPFPVLELADTSRFIFDYNYQVGKGTYNYILKIPPTEVSKARILSLMQQDLKRAFGYDARIETRSMPVWKLIANPGAAEKLITKGDPMFISPGTHAAGYTFKNVPGFYLIGGIKQYLKESLRELFIDDTGISSNIDFSIDADMTNLHDIRKELKKQGLDLVRGHKDLRVIVISDPVSAKIN